MKIDKFFFLLVISCITFENDCKVSSINLDSFSPSAEQYFNTKFEYLITKLSCEPELQKSCLSTIYHEVLQEGLVGLLADAKIKNLIDSMYNDITNNSEYREKLTKIRSVSEFEDQDKLDDAVLEFMDFVFQSFFSYIQRDCPGLRVPEKQALGNDKSEYMRIDNLQFFWLNRNIEFSDDGRNCLKAAAVVESLCWQELQESLNGKHSTIVGSN